MGDPRRSVPLALLSALGVVASCGAASVREVRPGGGGTGPIPARCVALLPWNNLSDYPEAGRILSEMAATRLLASRKVGVLEWSEVVHHLGTRWVSLPVGEGAIGADHGGGALDRSLVASLGGVAGGDAALFGTVRSFGRVRSFTASEASRSEVAFDLELVDTKTGQSLWSGEVSQEGSPGLLGGTPPLALVAEEGVDAVVASLIDRLAPGSGPSCRPAGASRASEPVAPPSAASLETPPARTAAVLPPPAPVPVPPLRPVSPALTPRQSALARKLVRTGSFVLEGVGFAPKSARIDAAGEAVLRDLGVVLRVHPECTVRIEGHTDAREKDLKLSLDRASEARRWLTGPGKIDPERVTIDGFGGDRPRMPNITESGRRKNRRLEVVVLKPARGGSYP